MKGKQLVVKWFEVAAPTPHTSFKFLRLEFSMRRVSEILASDNGTNVKSASTMEPVKSTFHTH